MKKQNLIFIKGTKNGVTTEFRIPLYPQTDYHISRAAAFQVVEALSDIGYSCRIIDFVTTRDNDYSEDSYPHIETDMHNGHIWKTIRYILNQ